MHFFLIYFTLQTIEIINQRSINQLHYNGQRKFATIIRLFNYILCILYNKVIIYYRKYQPIFIHYTLKMYIKIVSMITRKNVINKYLHLPLLQ